MNLDGNSIKQFSGLLDIYAKFEEQKKNYILAERGIISAKKSFKDIIGEIVEIISKIDFELSCGKNNTLFIGELYNDIVSNKIIVGTPILKNVNAKGKNNAAACSVIQPIVINGKINYRDLYKRATKLLITGVGIGIDLSETNDPVGALKIIDDQMFQIDEKLKSKRKRPVAAMVSLAAHHPKVLDFIDAKKDADFSRSRVTISLLVSELLFLSASQNQLWSLSSNDGNIQGNTPAKEILKRIASAVHYCGEPGILFIQRLENENATPEWKYITSAPCAEIAMSDKDACHFSYVNLSEFIKEDNGVSSFDFKSFGNSVRLTTRFLDSIVEYTINNNCFSQPIVSSKRRIGVGVAGFSTMLMNLGLSYSSNEAYLLAKQIAEYLSFYSIKESIELAKVRGRFNAFGNSKYTDINWIKRKQKFITGIISESEWSQLFNDLSVFGIRNASTVAFPPTGTSSQIAGVSSSFEPYLSLIDTYLNNDFIPNKILIELLKYIKLDLNKTDLICAIKQGNIKLNAYPQFKIASEISVKDQLKITEAFQNFADGGASKTVFLPNKSSKKDVINCFWLSYNMGLKGISVFRDNCLNDRNICI